MYLGQTPPYDPTQDVRRLYAGWMANLETTLFGPPPAVPGVTIGSTTVAPWLVVAGAVLLGLMLLRGGRR